MPNLFAYIVLFSYPLVVIVLFRRLPLPQALVWSIMGGYLFLPEHTEIDLPLLPALDKVLIPSLVAAIMCWLTPPPLQPRRATRDAAGSSPPARRPRPKGKEEKSFRHNWIANLCLLMLFVTPIGISMTNNDIVVAGPRVIAGIRTYDIFSMMLNTAVMVLPFLLARRHLATQEAHVQLLRAFVAAGLVYSLLILIEIRLSPQLHRWLYGFHAHLFGQQVRDGGYRPMVFIQHGLRVGLFILLSVLAAFTLYRERIASSSATGKLRGARDTATSPPQRTALAFYAFLWLFFILFMSKTLGAFMIASLFLPIMFLTKARHWRILSMVFALAVLVYPMMRSAGLAPVDRMYEFAQSISADRAHSFKFRLDNEDILLERASEKPLLGWGGWGRSRVYDPVSGKDLSVTDGTWVIVFGNAGWTGYLAQFGLLTLPAFLYMSSRGALANSIVTQGLCIILVVNLIDLIPNSGLTPVTWMVAGALLGRYERRPRGDPAKPTPRNRPSRDAPAAPALRSGSQSAV